MNTTAKPTSQYKTETPAMRRRREAREKKKADKLAAKIAAARKQEAEMTAAAIIKLEDWDRIEAYIRRIKKEGGRLLFGYFIEVLTAGRKLVMGWESAGTRSLASALHSEMRTLKSICEKYFKAGRIIRFEVIFRDARNEEETARVERIKKMTEAMFSGLIDRVKYRPDYPVFGSQITAEIKPAELSKLARS